MYGKPMKSLAGALLTFLMFLVSCEKINPYHEDGSEITAAEAVEIVRPIIKKYAEEYRPWSVSKNPIPARKTLKYGPFGRYDPASNKCGTFKSPGFKAWLIMIRPDGRINGSPNEALCLFVNVMTGEYEEINVGGVVSDIEWDQSFYGTIDDSPISYDSTTSVGPKRSRRLPSSTSGLYAVIISGGVDMEHNFSRYWNDCQYVYQRLTQTLGYDESHIYCLVADGSDPAIDMCYAYNFLNNTFYYKSSPLDFDNDGDNDIQYSATKANISAVFNSLQAQSSSIDHLLVFVTDHGTETGICLWGNNQELSPFEFYTELNKLSGVKKDVVLGQCFSGAFIPPLISSNVTVSTACSATENSKGQGLFSYDYFLHWWTDAFNPLNTSTVDTNADNMVSLREAFVYAAANDPAAITGEEHPQYASSPLIYGYTHDLLGADHCPVISGNDYLSCSFSSTYTLSGLASSVPVSWTSVGEMSLTSPTNSSVIAQGTLSSSDFVSFPAGILATFTLEGIQYYVKKDILSIWKPGYYFGPGYIHGGSGHYTLATGSGASGYQWTSDNSAWVVLTQGFADAYISEGPASGPVNLWVTFLDPFGNTVVAGSQFN